MNSAKSRSSAKEKIIQYMLTHPVTSKTELTKEVGLSMPTVLSCVNELLAMGLAAEYGEYRSTGGRKAKSIGFNKSYARAVGAVIFSDHLETVMVNLGSEIEAEKSIPLKFSPNLSYCTEAASEINAFINENTHDNLLGIGISIPGIIDQETESITKSHALQVENFSLHFLAQQLVYPVYFENDANAAMLAENREHYENALYLSLNHTLGGAFSINGELFRGQQQKAGEFGHMILIPGGKKCYCGKLGCADAYCAASVLTENSRITLDSFMEQVRSGVPEAVRKWEDYLDHLAILISNLRMAYDMDIVLGGAVGGVLGDYITALGNKIMACNGFDRDISYLKLCTYHREASALGAAGYFFREIL